MNKSSIIIAPLLLSAIALLFAAVQAAAPPRVYLKGPTEEIAPASEFEVFVFLDTNTPVNALDLEIIYPPQFEFLGFNNSASLVDIWYDGPKVYPDGRIELRGGLLEPFAGNGGEIVRLEFKAKEPGAFEAFFNKSDLYLGDGQGSKVLAENTSASILVGDKGESKNIGLADDVTPPTLTAEIIKDLIDGSVLLSFEARDKESGISHTLLRTKKWLQWSALRPVLNPVKLSAGIWLIEIKSFNGADLEDSQKLILWEEFFKKFGPPAVGAVLVIFLGVLFYNKKRWRG